MPTTLPPVARHDLLGVAGPRVEHALDIALEALALAGLRREVDGEVPDLLQRRPALQRQFDAAVRSMLAKGPLRTPHGRTIHLRVSGLPPLRRRPALLVNAPP